MDNLRKVKNIRLPKDNDLDVYPVSFAKSEIDPSDYGNMSSQVLAIFLIFPNESGYVEVPGASASMSTFAGKNKIISNKVKINVKNFLKILLNLLKMQ